jgi:ribosomal protein L9
LNDLKNKQAAENKRKQAELEEARKQAEAISRLEVVVKAKSGEKGSCLAQLPIKKSATH